MWLPIDCSAAGPEGEVLGKGQDSKRVGSDKPLSIYISILSLEPSYDATGSELPDPHHGQWA